MERTIDGDLAAIRQSLLRMGGLVEGMIHEALRALLERDSARADRLIKADLEVDLLEKEIDELCYSLLARYQPTAVDLRFVAAVVKINNDLERMGDSAVNIAQAVQILNNEPPLKSHGALPRLSKLVRQMVRESLDSFVQGNTELALEICGRDDQADGLYKEIFRDMLDLMIEDPQVVSRALQLLLVARNLERIADHATNISEDVVYYVEGRDIRHTGL